MYAVLEAIGNADSFEFRFGELPPSCLFVFSKVNAISTKGHENLQGITCSDDGAIVKLIIYKFKSTSESENVIFILLCCSSDSNPPTM